MIPRTLALGLALSTLLGAPVATAFPTQRPPVPKTFAEHRERVNARAAEGWDAIDTDHDGFISLQEWLDDDRSTMTLYAVDPERVSETEYLEAIFGPQDDPISGPAMRGRGDPYRAEFRKADRGRKGYLSRADLDTLSAMKFKRLDANGDGRLSRREALGQRPPPRRIPWPI